MNLFICFSQIVLIAHVLKYMRQPSTECAKYNYCSRTQLQFHSHNKITLNDNIYFDAK